MLVHITHQGNWRSIQDDGYLRPKNSTKALTSSRDPDKISVFDCREPVNSMVLVELRRIIAREKNLLREHPFTEDSFVILKINEGSDMNIQWEIYPKGINELTLNGMRGELVRQIIGYRKTNDKIPLYLISVVTP